MNGIKEDIPCSTKYWLNNLEADKERKNGNERGNEKPRSGRKGPVRKRRKFSEITAALRRCKSLPDLAGKSESTTKNYSKNTDSCEATESCEETEEGCRTRHKHTLCRANSNAQVQYVLIRDAIIENSRLELINLLTRKHANINHLGIDGLAAIHLAADQGTQQIMEILVSKGALINIRSEHGDYPLDLAVKAGNFEMAQFLIEKGARLDNVVNGTPPSRTKLEKTKRRSNTICS